MKLFKQLTVFLLVILMFSLLSTSCDKNSTKPGISALYGMWNWLQTHTKVTVAGVALYDTTEVPGNGEYTHITINEDGTFSSEDFDGATKTIDTGTYTVNGDSVTIKVEGEDPGTFHWSIAGDILTFLLNNTVTEQGITGQLYIESKFKKMN